MHWNLFPEKQYTTGNHITDHSQAERTVRPAASLRFSTTQFVVVLLCSISLWRDDMKFIAAFFFFKGFSAKQQKKPKKKEIITAL